MTGKEKLVMVKNALANVLRGSAAAAVALILPPFLTRLMSTQTFSAWSLVLQISAYVGYLDFGIQTAIGRFVAHDNETGDHQQRDQIVSTALIALIAAGALGVLAIMTIAASLPTLFHQMSGATVADARLALVIVGTSLAIGLPASVFNGIFVGLQRYELPAISIGLSRMVSAALLVLVARTGGSLTRMALVSAIVNLSSYGVQYLLYARLASGIRLSLQLVSIAAARKLSGYCLSLTVWSLAMLLVTGLDLILVGHFQYDAVGSYAVAATLITFLVGLQQAVFNVMIPSSAVEHARGNSQALGQIMVTATRYGAFLLLLTGIPLIVSSRFILSHWVTPQYAVQGVVLLRILVVANIVRLSAVPYVVALIGTGQQRLVTITPLLEGVSNLVVSVIAGYFMGAVGVALGTLAGALVGVMGNFVYNMSRTRGIEFHIAEYVCDGLLRPALCICPTLACLMLSRAYPFVSYWATIAAAPATFYLVWRWGLVHSERERLRWRLMVAQQ